MNYNSLTNYIVQSIKFYTNFSDLESVQKKVNNLIQEFFDYENISISKIEKIDIEELKNYIFCNMFIYILDSLKISKDLNQKIFKDILNYYKNIEVNKNVRERVK